MKTAQGNEVVHGGKQHILSSQKMGMQSTQSRELSVSAGSSSTREVASICGPGWEKAHPSSSFSFWMSAVWAPQAWGICKVLCFQLLFLYTRGPGEGTELLSGSDREALLMLETHREEEEGGNQVHSL